VRRPAPIITLDAAPSEERMPSPVPPTARHRVPTGALALAFLVGLTLAGQERWAPDKPEPGSAEAIAAFTTEPRFSSPWVAYVPDSATVPSPTKFLGHLVGAPGELTRTDRIYAYFRALAKATPRVRVENIGTSDEGREILLVAVADENGLRDLPQLKAAMASLADPRTTTPEAAERLIASARPFYYFNAGLHSSESGSPEMVMELAYRLAVSLSTRCRNRTAATGSSTGTTAI
jgi:hypothetical protein